MSSNGKRMLASLFGVRLSEDAPRLTSLIVCGTCGKLNCNNTNEKIFTCGWCGAQGELSDYEGDGINSAGDI